MGRQTRRGNGCRMRKRSCRPAASRFNGGNGCRMRKRSCRLAASGLHGGKRFLLVMASLAVTYINKINEKLLDAAYTGLISQYMLSSNGLITSCTWAAAFVACLPTRVPTIIKAMTMVIIDENKDSKPHLLLL